jgi:hypothetical protein
LEKRGVIEELTESKKSFVESPFFGWLLSLFVAIPVLSTQYLPLFDYQNHLARYALLARFQDSNVFRDFYQLNQKFIPNLGFDILATNLAKIMPVELAGQIILFASLFLGSLGFFKLAAKIHGKQTWLAAMPAIFLISFGFTFGFNNYILGIAFFPWALLSIEHYFDSNSISRLAVYVGIVVLAFVSHAFVAALILGFALVFAITANPSSLSLVKRSLASLAPMIVLVPILKASPSSGEFAHIDFGNVAHKVKIFYLAFFTGSMKADTLFMLLVASILVAILILRAASIDTRGKTIIGFSIGSIILCPMALAVASNLDARLVPILASLIFVFLVPKQPLKPLLVTMIIACIGLRVGAEFVHLKKSGEVVRSAAEQIEKLPDTAIVFDIVSDSSKMADIQRWNPPVLNLPHAGAWHRPIYVSGMYTYPNQQPVIYSERGSKLNYLGVDKGWSSDRSVSEQLTYHLWEIRNRMNQMPDDFWTLHQAYIFIGRTGPEDIALPAGIVVEHIEPKFILARVVLL